MFFKQSLKFLQSFYILVEFLDEFFFAFRIFVRQTFIMVFNRFLVEEPFVFTNNNIVAISLVK